VLPARPPRGRATGRTTAWRGSTCATPTPRRAGAGGLPAGARLRRARGFPGRHGRG